MSDVNALYTNLLFVDFNMTRQLLFFYLGHKSRPRKHKENNKHCDPLTGTQVKYTLGHIYVLTGYD